MGAGKRYSAGTIFLQVSPVFRKFQEDVADYVSDMDRVLGDRMEKSGEKAGERAGKAAAKSLTAEMEAELKRAADDMSKALGNVNTRNLGKKLRSEVKGMRDDLESLSDVDLKIDGNFAQAEAKLKALRTQIEAMRERSTVFFDTKGLPDVYRKIKTLEAVLANIKNPTLEVDLDTREAERKMGSFERSVKNAMGKAKGHIAGGTKEVGKLRDELDYLSRLRVNVDIGGAQIRKEVGEIMADLKRLADTSPDVDVRFEARKAHAELAKWNASLDKADGKKVKATASVDGANSFRSFNILLLATTSIGPAAIPVLAGIAGGLAAIGPAAAVAAFGLGAVLVGFSGLGDAMGALQARQDAQATTAQTNAKANVAASNAIRDAQEGLADAQRNAARAAVDAARAVKDARRSAADAIEDALERQKDAQEAYRDSILEVKDAEQALRDARADAAGTGHSLDDKIKGNDLSIQQGLLDSFDATNNYNAVMADGSSTNAEREQARISMEQAQLALHELRDEQKELAKEKKAWDKDGVNGTEQVKSAQESLNDAIAAQQDAYESMGDAAQGVDEARADGARAVADALRNQNEVLSDNKRAIEDARQALADARQGQDDLNDSITAQDAAVATAFDKLGPAGRKFALFLFSLKQGFREFRDDIQAAMLPSIQRAIEGFIGSSSAGTVRAMMVSLAAGFGDFVEALSKSFQGPAWLEFFETLGRLGPDIQAAYGMAFIKFMEAMASILTTLAPFALSFAEGLEKMMTAFAGWAASKEGTDAIQGFMQYAREVGPAVLDFIGSLAGAIGALAVALAPWGSIVLTGLTTFFDFIAGMDPATLMLIASALVVVITASQVAYAVMNALMAGTALLTSTVGLLVFGLILLAAGIVVVYQHNETLGTILGVLAGSIIAVIAAVKIWKALQAGWIIVTGFAALANTALGLAILSVGWPIILIIGAIALLVTAFIILWKNNEGFRNFIIDMWDKIKHAFSVAWDFIKMVLSGIGKGWKLLTKAFAWYWDKILKPVFSAWWKITKVLWKSVLKVIFLAITHGWKVLVWAIKGLWNNVLKPVWDAVKTAAVWLWEKSGLKMIFGEIGRGWDNLTNGIRDAWNKYVQPMWDDIREKALPKLKGAFETTVNGIKTVWNGLKAVIGTPIKFVLDTIINKGLIAGFNKVANWVGEDGFDPIPIPASIQKYASGGILPGYTPGRDPHKFYSPTGGALELSGGEAIMRPEFTAAVGSGFVDTMNAAARSGGIDGVRRLLGQGQRFAKGGIFFPVRGGYVERTPYNLGHDGMDINHANDASGNVPFVSATSGQVSSTGYSRGYGNAVFVRSPYGELVYGHAADGTVQVSPGQSVSPGQWLANIGDTGNSSGPHLHFGFPGGTFGAVESLLGGSLQPGKIEGAANAGRSVPGFIKDLLLNPIGTVKAWATSTFDKASDFITGTPVWDTLKDVPTTLVSGFGGKAWDMAPGWAKSTVGAVGDFAGAVKDGAGAVGGAIKGGVSAGLDAIGFADGGILPYNGTMKYDDGGYLPPGLTTVMNLTGKPEPVFTADQWDGMGGQGGGTIHYEPHFEGSDLTAEDVASDLNFTFRRIRRGGKYAGATA